MHFPRDKALQHEAGPPFIYFDLDDARALPAIIIVPFSQALLSTADEMLFFIIDA